MTERSTPPPSETERALEEASSLASESPAAAIEVLRAVFRAQPEHPEATRLLGKVLREQGQADWESKAISLSRALHSPELLRAAKLLNASELPAAEAILQTYLKSNPSEPSVRLLLADLAMRANRVGESEELLREALRLAPCYLTARSELAHLLFRENRLEQALEQFDRLLEAEPQNPRYLDYKARILNRLGRVEDAAAIYETMLTRRPNEATLWTHFAHSLRYLGRLEQSIAAYRKSLALDGTLTAVWWSLANLKTVTLSDEDIDAMLLTLADDRLDAGHRIPLHFALGKALEDQNEARAAFAHYLEGNALHRAASSYDPRWISGKVEEAGRKFDPTFFVERQSWGVTEAGPIFIVGMPRAGSTLIEQIVASHPAVEGLAELPYVAAMARKLVAKSGLEYPACLPTLDKDGSLALGGEYLELVAPHRTSDRPRYVDKNPNNWLFIDLLQLILPNCKIVDVRRHPLACGVSNFRQHFAEGQLFSYSLDHIGRYYRDYVSMLQRVDEVLPGRVHRIIYEDLVEDPRPVIEGLLEYLGLPFDAQCLNFHDNPRAVRTPSSEQVRQPINRKGLGQWQAFDRWLNPLKAALGSVLDSYPAAPGDLKSTIRSG